MKTTTKVHFKLSLTLFLLLLFWLITSRSFDDMAFLWMVLLAILSTLVIGRNVRKLSKRDCLIGLVLGGLVALSSPFLAVITILTYLASCLLLKDKAILQELLWPRHKQKFYQDVVYGLIPGLLLAGVNLLLAKVAMPEVNIGLPASFSFQPILNAIRAGVFEETAFTLFFFAFAVGLTKKEIFSKGENFLVYLIMIVPHTLVHFTRQEFELGNVLVLSFLFGLPFAFLLRKRGLVSAAMAHIIVDLIRFLLLGF